MCLTIFETQYIRNPLIISWTCGINLNRLTLMVSNCVSLWFSPICLSPANRKRLRSGPSQDRASIARARICTQSLMISGVARFRTVSSHRFQPFHVTIRLSVNVSLSARTSRKPDATAGSQVTAPAPNQYGLFESRFPHTRAGAPFDAAAPPLRSSEHTLSEMGHL